MLQDQDRLRSIRFQLRADGVRQTANPLRSGIHSRGYLPHVKRDGACYFVTFRLADSLPRQVLFQFQRQRDEYNMRAPVKQQSNARDEGDRELQRQIERYLDRGVGACYLRRPEIARIIAEALLHSHGREYLLHEWVVMPNHVHLALWPMPNHTLSDILRSRKRYTARQANLVLGRIGKPFWQPEAYDHWIRNDDEQARISLYIQNNPVSAGLCKTPEDWPWGSAGWSHQSPKI